MSCHQYDAITEALKYYYLYMVLLEYELDYDFGPAKYLRKKKYVLLFIQILFLCTELDIKMSYSLISAQSLTIASSEGHARPPNYGKLDHVRYFIYCVHVCYNFGKAP